MNSDSANLPVHIAIIMDGNGRWAKKRLKNRVEGHKKGADTVREIVTASAELHIPILTLYAFSTENWQRPKSEVSALMTLLNRFFISEKEKIVENNIRPNIIGQVHRLPESARRSIAELLEATNENNGLILNLALSYGGREEIVSAVSRIGKKIESRDISPESINEKLISDHLYTAGMPDPDLLIRTGGDMRVSNFLLWQIAYTELYITKTLWPDFTKEEFIEIIEEFRKRERRFGKV